MTTIQRHFAILQHRRSKQQTFKSYEKPYLPPRGRFFIYRVFGTGYRVAFLIFQLLYCKYICMKVFIFRAIIVVPFALCMYVGIPSTLHAATLYFDPSSADVYRGDSITLALRIDTEENECINTVEAVIKYDPSIRAVDISRGDSILNLWVEPPVIDENNHTISFAGGIPGGYCGRIPGDPRLTNVILEIVFRSPGLSIGGGSNPSARIWIDEASQVLLHDGFGTNAPALFLDSTITLLDSAGSAPADDWTAAVREDTDLPSDFAITLSKDEYAFNGMYFITFNSVDKQSGIDHYEVMEEPFSEFKTFKWGRADAPWIVTESPYVLIDQTLNSTIRVKAIDKAGNERIEVYVPDVALRSMSRDMQITIAISLGIVSILGSLILYAVIQRRRRITSSNLATHEEI